MVQVLESLGLEHDDPYPMTPDSRPPVGLQAHLTLGSRLPFSLLRRWKRLRMPLADKVVYTHLIEARPNARGYGMSHMVLLCLGTPAYVKRIGAVKPALDLLARGEAPKGRSRPPM